jgi:hypothetical protein
MDYQERKRRDRRVQVPPLSYWQDKEEQEYVDATTDIMDMVMITISFLVLFGIMFAVSWHFHIFWLLPVSLLMFVMWHMFWGRR